MIKAICLTMLLACTAALGGEDLRTNKKPKLSMEMMLAKRYLNIPIKDPGPGRKMTLTVDGKLLGQIGNRLAEDCSATDHNREAMAD